MSTSAQTHANQTSLEIYAHQPYIKLVNMNMQIHCIHPSINRIARNTKAIQIPFQNYTKPAIHKYLENQNLKHEYKIQAMLNQ